MHFVALSAYRRIAWSAELQVIYASDIAFAIDSSVRYFTIDHRFRLPFINNIQNPRRLSPAKANASDSGPNFSIVPSQYRASRCWRCAPCATGAKWFSTPQHFERLYLYEHSSLFAVSADFSPEIFRHFDAVTHSYAAAPRD